MDDGPFGPQTWLDCRKNVDTWQNQMNWTSGLGSQLTVTLDPGNSTSLNWSEGWRLPLVDESKLNLSGSFGYEGPDENGYHDYRHGYNMVNGELGYLSYEELGNKGYYATDGTYPQDGWGFQNTGDFDKLQAGYYWTGTVYSPNTD